MKHAPEFLKLVNDAKTRVRETTVQEIKKRLRVNRVDGTDEREGIINAMNEICRASGLAKPEDSNPGEVQAPGQEAVPAQPDVAR